MHRRSTTRSEVAPRRLLLDASVSVRQVMRPCLAVRSGTGVQHARLEMLELEAPEVVVIDVEGRPVGLVHGDDLLHDAIEAEAAEVMSSHHRPAAEPFALETDSGDDGEGQPVAAEAPLLVDDVLSASFAKMRQEGSISEAATLMKRERCEAVLVVNQSDRLVGIVTAEDIVNWVASATTSSSRPRKGAGAN